MAKSNSFKVISFHLKTLVHLPFPQFKTFWKAFSGIFLSSVVAAILMELMSEKWVSFRTDLILGKRRKSHGVRSGKYGGVPKLQCFFFCEKLMNTQGCVSRSIIVMERPCMGFPKALLLVTH